MVAFSRLAVATMLLLVGCSTGNAPFDDDAGAGKPDATVDAPSNDGGTPVSCGASSVLCSGSCTNTQSDNLNCGACGTACAQGEVCSKGKCALTCGGGTTQCGSSCVDTNLDPKNCGGCGKACTGGQVCGNGTCGSSCGSGQAFCGGDGGAPYCATTQTDNANCGACGIACALGESCSGGTCVSGCLGSDGGAETLCTPDGGAAYCATTQTDNANCGGCGIKCGTAQVCEGGQCVLGCPASDGGVQTLCAADGSTPYCADTQTSNANCGACGKACGNGQACSNGQCTTNCGNGDTLCNTGDAGAYCASLQSDNANCGTCGKSCGTGKCVSGTCTAASTSYFDSFTTNVAASTQCTHWQTFVAGLSGNSYSGMRMQGTDDTTGITCNDSTVTTNMATALANGTAYTATCNGHTWSNCNRYGDELWIDPPSQCSVSNCPTPGYLMRPCIAVSSPGNVNWGGVNSATCSGPTQTMALTFF
jgi:hypothetical protein